MSRTTIFRFLSIPILCALNSCDGPWNALPSDTQTPPSLEVSLMLVAGRRFDTLRVQPPRPMDGSSLSSGWIDTAKSSAVLHREGSSDSVIYRPLAADPTLWVPVASDSVVRLGAAWNLALDVAWNDGSGSVRFDKIRGTARIPTGCAIGPTIQVPAALRDSLLASDPRGGRGRLETSALDSLRNCLLPWRELSSGDTLWFPHSLEPFPDPAGVGIPLTFQKMSIPLRRDASLWGGVWGEMGFSRSAKRIVSARVRRENPDDAEDPDELRVPGYRKVLEYQEAGTIADDPNWPDRWRLESDLLDRTGPVVLRVYFPEPGLLEWRRGQRSAANANGLLRPKLVGAQGFVAGACVDSLKFTIRATRDTVASISL